MKICELELIRNPSEGTGFAGNAHLIAAAPEMYEMLESLYRSIKNMPLCDSYLYDRAEEIEQLLAKARGEQ